MATFAMSGALGGISGVFLGMNYSLYPQLGQLVVKGFIASVIAAIVLLVIYGRIKQN